MARLSRYATFPYSPLHHGTVAFWREAYPLGVFIVLVLRLAETRRRKGENGNGYEEGELTSIVSATHVSSVHRSSAGFDPEVSHGKKRSQLVAGVGKCLGAAFQSIDDGQHAHDVQSEFLAVGDRLQ